MFFLRRILFYLIGEVSGSLGTNSGRKCITKDEFLQSLGYHRVRCRSPTFAPEDQECQADEIRQVKDRQLKNIDGQNKVDMS